MATSSDFSEEQLQAARTPLWHQAGEPVLTLEGAREFIERFGLVLFAPGRVAMTAPSLVEATLGTKKEAVSLAESNVARELVSRLVADGAVLPLNLLGGSGDMPDFVVSAANFRFIFTMRGDKTWKQPPSTSGATKVSPLALRVFETLTARGALTAAELANELGREVTEAAIVRALVELWQMLRVIPLPGLGDAPTLWELTTRRFTKQIKAGVNAGQPTAMSALVSLYLHQVLAATSDEIESFLSPLASRSRVREVLHALTAARELGENVVAGKTLLHISGELPEFPEIEQPVAAEGEEGAVAAAEPAERPSRIRKFDRTERPERPAGRGAFGGENREERGGSLARSPRTEAERRPFRRDAGEGKPGYTKPWDEEKPRRPRPPFAAEGGEHGERKPFTRRPESSEGRRPFRRREEGAEGGRSFGGDRERKPFARREGGKPFERRERRPLPPRGEGAAEGRERRPFEKREGGSFERRERRPFAPREGGSFERRERRPFPPREGGSAEGRESRPFERRERRPFEKREGGFEGRERRPFQKREGGSEGRERRPFTPREGAPFEKRERRPFVKREGGSFEKREGGAFERRERRPFEKREGGAFERRERRPFTPREGEGGERPARPFTPRGPKPFGSKPNFGAKKGSFGAGKERGGFAGGKNRGAGKPQGRKFGGGASGGWKPSGRGRKPGAEE